MTTITYNEFNYFSEWAKAYYKADRITFETGLGPDVYVVYRYTGNHYNYTSYTAKEIKIIARNYQKETYNTC